MSEHKFRNPDKIQKLTYRDFLRVHLPDSRSGFVAEDLDLLVRVYGANFDTDANGKFMLIEVKGKKGRIHRSKIMTFGMIDELLRKADPDRKRYLGYYVIQTDTPEWEDRSKFWLNGKPISCESLISFFETKLEIPPVDFSRKRYRRISG